MTRYLFPAVKLACGHRSRRCGPPLPLLLAALLWGAAALPGAVAAENTGAATTPRPPLALAILPFEATGAAVPEVNRVFVDLLAAELTRRPDFSLVERVDEKAIRQEQELNRSGLVAADRAVQLGQELGADLVLTGRLLALGAQRKFILKLCSTETGQMIGFTVPLTTDEVLPAQAAQVAGQLADGVRARYVELVPSREPLPEKLAGLKQKIPAGAKPPVLLRVQVATDNPESGPAIEGAVNETVRACLEAAGTRAGAPQSNAPFTADIVLNVKRTGALRDRTGTQIICRVRISRPGTAAPVAQREKTLTVVAKKGKEDTLGAVQRAVADVMIETIPAFLGNPVPAIPK